MPPHRYLPYSGDNGRLCPAHPLILTSTVAFITARTFQKYSIYNEQLAITGELITHDKDKAVMTLLDWSREVERTC